MPSSSASGAMSHKSLPPSLRDYRSGLSPPFFLPASLRDYMRVTMSHKCIRRRATAGVIRLRTH